MARGSVMVHMIERHHFNSNYDFVNNFVFHLELRTANTFLISFPRNYSERENHDTSVSIFKAQWGFEYPDLNRKEGFRIPIFFVTIELQRHFNSNLKSHDDISSLYTGNKSKF